MVNFKRGKEGLVFSLWLANPAALDLIVKQHLLVGITGQSRIFCLRAGVLEGERACGPNTPAFEVIPNKQLEHWLPIRR